MTDATPLTTGAKIALIVFGILFLLPGACGTLFFGASLAEWAASGFQLRRGELDLAPGIVGISATSLVGSVMAVGVILRISRWSSAPVLSLVLAIIAAFVTVFGTLMLAGRIGGTEDATVLAVSALGGLLLGALPPFLFWRQKRVRPTPDPAP